MLYASAALWRNKWW